MEDNFEDYDICAIGLQFKGGYSLDFYDHRQNRMLPHGPLSQFGSDCPHRGKREEKSMHEAKRMHCFSSEHF